MLHKAYQEPGCRTSTGLQAARPVSAPSHRSPSASLQESKQLIASILSYYAHRYLQTCRIRNRSFALHDAVANCRYRKAEEDDELIVRAAEYSPVRPRGGAKARCGSTVATSLNSARTHDFPTRGLTSLFRVFGNTQLNQMSFDASSVAQISMRLNLDDQTQAQALQLLTLVKAALGTRTQAEEVTFIDHVIGIRFTLFQVLAFCVSIFLVSATQPIGNGVKLHQLADASKITCVCTCKLTFRSINV